MIERQPAAAILLDQRERRTGDLRGVDAEPFGQAADERGLPRPEIAGQQHDVARLQPGAELAAGGGGFASDWVAMVTVVTVRQGWTYSRRSVRFSGPAFLDDLAARRQLHHRVAEVRGEVAGGHRHFALVGLGEIAGHAVQVDGELAGGLGIEQLRQPGGDHAGQHVAGAAGRHARRCRSG